MGLGGIIQAVAWALGGLALLGGLAWLALYGRGQAKAGATAQAARGDAVAAKVEAAVAEAVTQAPTTPEAVEDRLDKGTF